MRRPWGHSPERQGSAVAGCGPRCPLSRGGGVYPLFSGVSRSSSSSSATQRTDTWRTRNLSTTTIASTPEVLIGFAVGTHCNPGTMICVRNRRFGFWEVPNWIFGGPGVNPSYCYCAVVNRSCEGEGSVHVRGGFFTRNKFITRNKLTRASRIIHRT